MRIFFLGAEAPDHRKLLVDAGINNIGLSFAGLYDKRLPKTKSYTLSDKFPGDQNLFVDSGGYSANNAAEKRTVAGWKAYSLTYQDFITHNIDRIEFCSEFDCLVLGQEWIQEQRSLFYDHLPREKFLPIWHPQTGFGELERLAQEYERVGISESAILSAGNIAPRLNGLIQKYGVLVHGLSMTKPDEMRNIKFDSVASTSWISPMKYGDTIVWDGTRLHRYPKKYKAQARKRYKTLFEREGFDAEAILNDEFQEVTRMTLWSWQRFEDSVNGSKRVVAPVLSDNSEDYADSLDAENDPGDVDNKALDVRKPEPVNKEPVTRRPDSERTIIPVLGFASRETEVMDEDGNMKTVSTNVPVISRNSLRICDTCYLADRCPAFKPGNDCAYNIPIEVRTKEQLMSLLTGMIEMQTQRIMFMRFAEEANGGYADPNLSQEEDRLFKMVKDLKEIEDNREFMKINVEARGGAGVLSRLFGEERAAVLHQVNQPLDPHQTDVYARQIIDAEVVSDDKKA